MKTVQICVGSGDVNSSGTTLGNAIKEAYYNLVHIWLIRDFCLSFCMRLRTADQKQLVPEFWQALCSCEFIHK